MHNDNLLHYYMLVQLYKHVILLLSHLLYTSFDGILSIVYEFSSKNHLLWNHGLSGVGIISCRGIVGKIFFCFGLCNRFYHRICPCTFLSVLSVSPFFFWAIFHISLLKLVFLRKITPFLTTLSPLYPFNSSLRIQWTIDPCHERSA